MKIKAKFNADVGNAIKFQFWPDLNGVVASPVISFSQDKAQLSKRFGSELADAVFAALEERPQKNIPTEELEHDVYWIVKKFDPMLVFVTHYLTLDGLQFDCNPQFKGILPKKGKAEVEVKIMFPIQVKGKTAAQVAAMAGQTVAVELEPKPEVVEGDELEPVAVAPKIKRGRFGNPEQVSV